MGISRRQLFLGGMLAAGSAGITKPEVVRAGVDDDVNELVGQQNRIYFDNQKPHIYDYSAPRDVVLQLYDAIVPHMMDTWTVFYVPGVGAVDVTPSKGYPIPYGSQLTSPEYRSTGSSGAVNLPQPEPDGLYRSGETAATWVLSVNEDGYIIPEYHEEICVCYPFPVTIDPATRMVVRNAKSASVTVDLSRAG